jgi:hypothetical protein
LTLALFGDIESNSRKAFFSVEIQPDFRAYSIMYNRISALISDWNTGGILFIANFKSEFPLLEFILVKRTRITPKKDVLNVLSLYLEAHGKFGQEGSTVIAEIIQDTQIEIHPQ